MQQNERPPDSRPQQPWYEKPRGPLAPEEQDGWDREMRKPDKIARRSIQWREW